MQPEIQPEKQPAFDFPATHKKLCLVPWLILDACKLGFSQIFDCEKSTEDNRVSDPTWGIPSVQGFRERRHRPIPEQQE